MRIAQFHAEHLKRLKVVDITPEPHLQVLSGSNASGKSSILDAIWWALAGKKPIQSRPINDEATTAVVRLDLGEIIVKRTFERDGDDFKTTLLVLNAVGAEPGTPDKKLPKWGSPQDMLDALLGELTFDPLQFARSKPAEQFQTLRGMVKLSVDIDALDKANAADYAARTEVNREAKQKRAAAEAIAIPDGTPEEAVDESALLDGIEEAGKFNADIERRRANRTRVMAEISMLRSQAKNNLDRVAIVQDKATERIAELRRQIASIEEETIVEVGNLQSNATLSSTRADELQAKVDGAPSLPEPISISGLRASLDGAKATNAAVASRERRKALLVEADNLDAAAVALGNKIDDRMRQKHEAIKQADMPVAGLGFGADFITYRGRPFDQASSAEQLRVSVAVAMAANPKLRVLRIKDGGLLDKDGFRIIAEMAAERDFQVWIEAVNPPGEIGIVMEDGAVKR